MYEIRLPRLVGSRASVGHYVDGWPPSLRGERVVVQARNLQSGTPSFADELVSRVLVTKQAAELAVVGAAPEFERYIREAANARQVSERVALLPAGAG